MRMAAVFTLTTVTIARRTRIVSRLLTVAGLACAVVLMVGIGITQWAELVFPAWILALSLDILAAGRRASSAERIAGPSEPGPLNGRAGSRPAPRRRTQHGVAGWSSAAGDACPVAGRVCLVVRA